MKKYIINVFVAFTILFANEMYSQSNNDTIVRVNLEEVIISTPFKESVKNNVLKVDKLNLNDLKIINAKSFSYSLLKIPGVSIISSGPGISKPSIRGLAGNRIVTYTQFSRLENQQWGDEHDLQADAFGIQSIEVIKGPMSVIYGGDAMGGVIYLTPDDYVYDDLQVEIGSYYNANYSGFTNNLGIKGSAGDFGYIIQGSYIDNGNYETPDGEVENTFTENTELNFGIGYKSDNFISDLRFNYSESNIGVPHADEHDEHGDDHDEDHDEDHDDDHDEDHDDDQDEDHDEHQEEAPEGEAELDMELTTTTVDLKYLFPKNGKSEFVIGSNLMFQENLNFGHEVLVPNSKKNDFGLYSISHIHGKVWDVMIGLRADFRNVTAEGFDKNYSSLTGSFGLKGNLGNGIMRINFASGYRAPNLHELFSDGVHHGTLRYEVGDKDLSVEKNIQTDFSITTYSENSQFDFALFYNGFNDYIYLNPTSRTEDDYQVYEYIQKDASLFGGEISYTRESEIDWLSYESSLEFITGYTTDKEYLPFLSPITLNHSFNLDFDKSSFEISALFKGKKQKVPTYETQTDSYFLMNISGSHDFNFLNKTLTLGWSVNNLFDKEYFDHLSRFKNMGIHEMGRNISVGLKYIF